MNEEPESIEEEEKELQEGGLTAGHVVMIGFLICIILGLIAGCYLHKAVGHPLTGLNRLRVGLGLGLGLGGKKG